MAETRGRFSLYVESMDYRWANSPFSLSPSEHIKYLSLLDSMTKGSRNKAILPHDPDHQTHFSETSDLLSNAEKITANIVPSPFRAMRLDPMCPVGVFHLLSLHR